MFQQQVLLRGGGRLRHILIGALLVAIGLLILHYWSPGTIISVGSAVLRFIARIPSFIADIINGIREVMHQISGGCA